MSIIPDYDYIMPMLLSVTPTQQCKAQHAQRVCMKSFSCLCDLFVDCLVGLLDVAFSNHGDFIHKHGEIILKIISDDEAGRRSLDPWSVRRQAAGRYTGKQRSSQFVMKHLKHENQFSLSQAVKTEHELKQLTPPTTSLLYCIFIATSK